MTDHTIKIEALIRWLDSLLKPLPSDNDYNKGYNDALLDTRNALKTAQLKHESVNPTDRTGHQATA